MAAQPTTADQLRLLWRVAGLAFMLAAETAAGAFLGWLYDRWQGTAPKGLTIGGLIGLVVGLVSFVRAALAVARPVRPPDPARRGTPLGPRQRADDHS
jgi:F0F1-type ATP synthase assembly protein I